MNSPRVYFIFIIYALTEIMDIVQGDREINE